MVGSLVARQSGHDVDRFTIGPRMRMTVLDCPAGYVCRLLHTNEYKMPKRPSAIPESPLPFLKLALKTKVCV